MLTLTVSFVSSLFVRSLKSLRERQQNGKAGFKEDGDVDLSKEKKTLIDEEKAEIGKVRVSWCLMIPYCWCGALHSFDTLVLTLMCFTFPVTINPYFPWSCWSKRCGKDLILPRTEDCYV